ncbi:MAG: hypothetical protein A3J66_00420 [Candidatus Magasanikbacteria bacterium RIFCSPHIGHO2_02_FULL_47_14]|uniref:Tellurium resistance protein TerC n=1 Tax=Candidatus Magasanikbacteria bacterium RIFCSPHIGHO2_02_FULL_47_14 TaxID=1798680 RepID=A0A1F6M2P0_9BACT|nr:MAG: hypothetical protein A3J66_00420 [Candidatus Magasanikbacteria bacterium RIFCSPHIGHO2_02_FULL_47_14]
MLWESFIVILGLIVFEVISSVDNAIVNAHVLKTLPERFRKIFLFWGLLLAVFVVRGVLPFVIIWIASPGLSLPEVWGVAFSSESHVEEYLETSKPLLLLGGGMYLFLVFLAWLFLEEKKYAFFVEHFIHKQGVWFYFLSSLFFTVTIYFSIQKNPLLALAAAIGTTAFFLTDGFKQNAEKKEQELIRSPSLSAWSKILYLEVLDASFSIDGVVGAFAFTLSIPLILIGNGIGAFVVREFTIRGIDLISKYAYLKNGAMYSIGMLGGLMILESFGREFPFWLAPLNTFSLLALFLFLSYKEIKKTQKNISP